MEDDIISKQRKQSVHVAADTGAYELVGQLFTLLKRTSIVRTVCFQKLSRSECDLATVLLALPHHGGDFSVLVVEYLVQ